MHSIIMAGGKGSRMRPLTDRRPKPLLPLFDRPVIGYVVNHLRHHGLRNVTVTLGPQADAIRAYLGTGADRGLSIGYAREDRPLGTAGSVRNASHSFRGRFLVMGADVITDMDLTAAMAFHQEHGGLVTIALTRVEDPSPFGVVETAEDGEVVRFVEKPEPGAAFSNLVSTGIYLCEPEVLERIPADRSFDFARDLFPRMLAEPGSVFGWEVGAYWADVGSPNQYLRSHLELLHGWADVELPGHEVVPGVRAGRDASFSLADVDPPVYIGDDAVIEPGVRLGPGTVVGRGVLVETGAVIRSSVLHEGVVVARDAGVDHALVGAHSHLGQGVRVQGGVVGEETRLTGGVLVDAG